jgi:N-acetylglutamate synthase-like GNAT family acetyltransferase
MEWKKNQYMISDDKNLLDLSFIHEFLTKSYWSLGIQDSIVKKSIENSLTFGVFEGNKQIGFAKMITDRATFAYLADVFIVNEYCGKGLGKWLMECIMSHPDLQGLRRMMLATRDAHSLYSKFGFTALTQAERFMEIRNLEAYKLL